MQLESESLADYSRALMQLQNSMEQAAASESAALVLLRDNALKEQFVQGVREKSVRQVLRRIAYHSVDKSFHTCGMRRCIYCTRTMSVIILCESERQK